MPRRRIAFDFDSADALDPFSSHFDNPMVSDFKDVAHTLLSCQVLTRLLLFI